MVIAWLNLINELKIAKAGGKKRFYTTKSKKKRELLHLLLKENLITKVVVAIRRVRVKYYKVYVNTKINYTIEPMSSPNSIKYVSKADLKEILKKQNVQLIISTPNGLISLSNIVNDNNNGGVLLFSVH